MTDASAGSQAASNRDKAPIGSLRILWPFVNKYRLLFIAWLFALEAASAVTLTLPVAFKTMRARTSNSPPPSRSRARTPVTRSPAPVKPVAAT